MTQPARRQVERAPLDPVWPPRQRPELKGLLWECCIRRNGVTEEVVEWAKIERLPVF